MRHRRTLVALLARDAVRMEALRAVRAVALPDGWIGAGFVRDAVWDHLHGFPVTPPSGDVDVVWFDPLRPHAQTDRALTQRLRREAPGIAWSVKNQARMHERNDDAPYRDVADAMRHWPETATAVAARLDATGRIALCAPFGLDDLFAPILRPTPRFRAEKHPLFRQRAADKRWLERYPRLTLASC